MSHVQSVFSVVRCDNMVTINFDTRLLAWKHHYQRDNIAMNVQTPPIVLEIG